MTVKHHVSVFVLETAVNLFKVKAFRATTIIVEHHMVTDFRYLLCMQDFKRTKFDLECKMKDYIYFVLEEYYGVGLSNFKTDLSKLL